MAGNMPDYSIDTLQADFFTTPSVIMPKPGPIK